MRRNWNDGQENVFEDFSAIAPALERGLFDRVVYELVHRKEDAFFGDGFKVNFSTSTEVSVVKGLGFQTDGTQTSPEPTKRMLYRGANVNKSLVAPDGANDRIDVISVKAAVVNELSATRKYKDPVSSAVSNQNLVVQKDWEAEINVTTGTPAGSPSAPATPAGEVKIAECYVHAVSGMASQVDITDSRSLMPIGEELLLNTTGYTRLTAAAAVRISTLMGEIDALLKNGYFEFFDVDELGADPAAPLAASNKRRIYSKGGTLYVRDQAPGGAITPIGSGGGGGGGLVWTAPDGEAPVATEEYGQDVFLFQAGLSQKLRVFIKVPEGYISGRPIYLLIGQYSPSAANTQLLKINSALIRQNNDPVDTPWKNRDSTNSALTNTVAKQYRKVQLDVTDGSGQIDGGSVTAGDLIEVELSRGTDTDTADVRFIPTATELKIG